MAQYRLNAYDADVFIPEFRGLYQAGDQMGSDLRYSPDCMNVECIDGVLQPVTPISGAKLMKNVSGNLVSLDANIATMMYLRATVGAGASPIDLGGLHGRLSLTEHNSHDLFIFYADGKEYAISLLGAPMETGVYDVGTGTTVTKTDVDWTTYETEVTDTMLNKYKVNTIVTSEMTRGDDPLHPVTINCVARYAERVWAAGAYSVYYSRPFSTSDWTQDDDDPANGGGQIDIPTFDRDEIVAMKPLGDSLIIFSHKRAWKLSGTDPTNFIIQEQYGNGVSHPRTVVVMGKSIIMLGEEGLVAYDGYQVTPILRGQTQEMFRHIDITEKSIKAARVGSRYLLTFAGEIGTGLVQQFNITENGFISTDDPPDETVRDTVDMREGYKLLIYDENDGSVTIRDTPQILSFCGDEPYAMVKVGHDCYIARLTFDSWSQHQITTQATKWVSPWITLGREDIKKGGFELYFTPEVESKKTLVHQYWDKPDGTWYQVYKQADKTYPVLTYTESTGDVDLKISIQTEKKIKTKTYKVKALTAAELLVDKKHKMKRLHFGGTGRRFRVIIETEAGNTIPWRLIGGIQIVAETDAD